MKFHILTLFPEMMEMVLKESIIGRAQQGNLIEVEAINIRDYAHNKHRHVDDYPYGGGAGMLMQAAPICEAYEELSKKLGKRPKVLYMTPQGKVFNQGLAKELAREENLVFLCGHYEGVDERALELLNVESVSIGDYVLTGGELPAMVVADAVARMIPGVLGAASGAQEDSFYEPLLECPQYTKPPEFRGWVVPDVLRSGHHKNIATWRQKEALKRTRLLRPDLLERPLTKEEIKLLKEIVEEESRL